MKHLSLGVSIIVLLLLDLKKKHYVEINRAAQVPLSHFKVVFLIAMVMHPQ